ENNQPAEAASSSLALRQRALFFGSSVKAVWEIISDILTFAADMIPEQSDSIAEIDHAVRTDCGWLTGPFELWDNIGLWPVLDRLKNENRPVPLNAQKMLICGAERFYKISDGQKQYFHFDSRTYKAVPESFL
ncbi:MAG: 3-hydroxyacyl-CoA dehydrogenase family protein, partial [Leptospirales bacterium]|nr:3-hydroxyacyl-CoA dehydrogenase family protein [Leptospirales bacterium]